MIAVDHFINHVSISKKLRYRQSMVMEHYEPDSCNKHLIQIEEVLTVNSNKKNVVRDYLQDIQKQTR